MVPRLALLGQAACFLEPWSLLPGRSRQFESKGHKDNELWPEGAHVLQPVRQVPEPPVSQQLRVTRAGQCSYKVPPSDLGPGLPLLSRQASQLLISRPFTPLMGCPTVALAFLPAEFENRLGRLEIKPKSNQHRKKVYAQIPEAPVGSGWATSFNFRPWERS